MTNAEAVSLLMNISAYDIDNKRGMQKQEALEMAIKALERETILDKIRAEIENHCGLTKENHCRYCSYCNSLMGVREILETIDKYKAKSEV